MPGGAISARMSLRGWGLCFLQFSVNEKWRYYGAPRGGDENGHLLTGVDRARDAVLRRLLNRDGDARLRGDLADGEHQGRHRCMREIGRNQYVDLLEAGGIAGCIAGIFDRGRLGLEAIANTNRSTLAASNLQNDT